ncbi:hypothetical protein [Rhodococcus rhodochrous]|uniref:hypothetical protein n=1 Tax=Rhodococcus rhodochrous TaxID=1829 RepID=UPI000A5BE15A|nr:hypothetical protein [Rhodococcus rhodochrous]
MSFLPLSAGAPVDEAEAMTVLLLVLVVFVMLDALALTGRTPDTHRECTQFGDYRV